jgi:hypothetical protein
MEETLEGGRGPPRAVAPLEREKNNSNRSVEAHICATDNRLYQFYKVLILQVSYEEESNTIGSQCIQISTAMNHLCKQQ